MPVILMVVLAAVASSPGWLAARTGSQEIERADLILHNGKIFTADNLGSIQSAVAIRGERIVAVGREEILQRYAATRTVDLGGRFVCPGFNDTHIHMRGYARSYVHLFGAKSIGEILDRIRSKAEELGPGKWITGWGWSEDDLLEQRRPLRWDLDQAAPRNPVLVNRAGGHSGVANSLALDIAGLTAETPQPEGGLIEKDDQGRLNGIIRERQGLVGRHVPPADPQRLRDSLAENLEDLLSFGITSIINASTGAGEYPEWEKIYQERGRDLPRAAVQITPPFGAGVMADEALKKLREFGLVTGHGDERLQVGPLKVFVDGGYTGPAAWTLEHYRDQPDYYGKARTTRHELYKLVKATHEMGWQMGFHTIGDAAIKEAVEVFVEVLQESPRPDHRHFLNHFTVTPPVSIMRMMAHHNILISQQPNFVYTIEGRYAANLVGERLQHNNPMRTPMSHGIFVAMASDIMPIGPMVGLYGAVERRGMSGALYGPEERISMPEAITAYTRNGAYLTFEEDIKGTIEPGKLADIVVLSDDLLAMDPERILDVSVEMTILGGRIVYERR